MKRSEALAIRQTLEEVVQLLDDENAEKVIMFFPEATDDTEMVKGKKYRHNGKLKKAKKNKAKGEKVNEEHFRFGQ